MSAERDYLTALSIAALLEVDLEPWQEFVLRAMLEAHRRPDPPTVAVRGPYGTCDEPHPEFPYASCKRARGHTGYHDSVTGLPARSVRWPTTKAECGHRFPHAGSIACRKSSGHVGDHDSKPGSSGGYTWT